MIDPRSPSDADRAEFARLIEIYGADRRRWPSGLRPLYNALGDDAAHIDLMKEAAALDAALDLSIAPIADDRLKDRLLAGFEPAPRRAGLLSGMPALRRWLRLAPAGALAALSAAGFVVGSATAGTGDESLYYAEAAMEQPLSMQAGLWPEGQ